MPRTGSMAADIADYLRRKPGGATIKEIAEALAKVRRSPVLRHSVRSAIYQHANGQGENLFQKTERGSYSLRKTS